MLPQLAAERQMQAIEAASVPYMEDRARRDVIDRHTGVANVDRSRASSRAASAADLAAIGISVETFTAEPPTRKAATAATK